MKATANLKEKGTEGSYLYQYLAAFAATLNVISSGMVYGWSSPSLAILLETGNATLDASKFTVTNEEGSWIAVMPLMGSIIGALTGALAVDFLGRKRSVLLNCFPYFGSWLMVAFAQNVYIIYVARFVAGVSDGWVFIAVPMYIGEIAEPKIRGFLGSSVSLTWIFGILLINLIGSYFNITATAIIASSMPILCLIIFIWMPDSPYELILKGNLEGAKKNMRILRGYDNVDIEIKKIHEVILIETQDRGSFLDLFTIRSNRNALMIMLGVRGAQQLSGTTAITFYTQPIFKEVGDDISPKLATLIYVSVQLTIATFSSSIVDRTGRRPLLMFSITGSAICLCIEGTYFYIKTCTSIDINSFSYVPVIALIGYVITFSSGMQSIPILLLGELFPTDTKAFALGLIDIFFCIIASGVSKFFQIMKDSFGMYVPMYVFSICCIFGLIFIIVFVPETKGKTLEEIQEYFKIRKPNTKDKKVCELKNSVLDNARY